MLALGVVETVHLASVHLARKVGELTLAVESRWPGLPQQDRDELRALAYGVLEVSNHHEPPLQRLLWLPVHLALQVYWRLNGTLPRLVRLMQALHRFVDAVADAVEREDVQLRATLAERVDDALTGRATRRGATSQDFGEWLASVPDRADRRV